MMPRPRGMALGIVMATCSALVIASAVVLLTLVTHRSIRANGHRHDQLTWLARSAALNGTPGEISLEAPVKIDLLHEVRGRWSAATATSGDGRVQVHLLRGPDGSILEWTESHGR